MKKIVLIVVVVFASAMVACKGGEKNKNTDWETLEQSGCTIQYPDSLEVNTTGVIGASFILFFNQTSPEDAFRENINLMIQDLSGYDISFDDYVGISESQVATMITDSNLIESSRLEKDGAEYHKMVYTGKQGVFDLKFEQYFTIRNKKVYVLTFTAETDQFDSYKNVAEKILDSFKLK